MSERKLTALGTASQVPTRQRNQTGFFLRWDNEGFLFDPGEGTQRRMTICGISASSITKIFITHFHGDHCLGLPGVIQRVSLDRVAHPVEIYYPASGHDYFERLLNSSAYLNAAELKPRPISSNGEIFAGQKLTISALPLEHSIDVLGYRIRETDGFTMLPDRLEKEGITGAAVGELLRHGEIMIDGRRIQMHEMGVPKPGQSVAFVMDTRLCQNLFKLADGVDLLVCESTYLSGDEHLAANYYHLTAAQAATVAKETGAGKLALSHFSQRYTSENAFEKEAAAIFPHTTALKDGDTIVLSRKRNC
ncbi:MAG: ribonuclease Z [Proteobacteria bacterium]|nr:ribonuclease Z [Pseudomonadota bacterium]